MKKPLIAGNWKMNLNRAESVALGQAVAHGAGRLTQVELVVCPAMPYLDAVSSAMSGSQVALGGQNMHHERSGAYTGETSAAMLVDVGCRYVILGHSERRYILGETDADVHRKLAAALAAGLRPIVCVGEQLAEREAEQTQDVVRRQFDGSLAGLSNDQAARLVLAYEPVWAIGTGKVATPGQAEEVHLALRNLLRNRYNDQVAQTVRILYGGSVKPENAGELLAQSNIDGALVGGASLKAGDFLAIAGAAG